MVQGFYWSYIRIMEKKVVATIEGFRVQGVGFRLRGAPYSHLKSQTLNPES